MTSEMHDGDSVAQCLARLAADLRRECAAGRIRGRLGRGNAIGLATAIDRALGAGSPSPRSVRELHQHLTGLLGYAGGAG